MGNISNILNIILGILTIYLYIENRRLKGFEVGKNIEVKKLEIEELERNFPLDKERLDEEFNRRGAYHSGGRARAQQYLSKDYENKKGRLSAELEYLRKLKRYKWIFSK